MLRLITGLFRCRHANLTWPQSQRRPLGPAQPFQREIKAHCTCLDCGQEFEVDPQTLIVGKRIFPAPHIASPTLDSPESQEAL